MRVVEAANRYYFASRFQRDKPETIRDAKAHFDYEVMHWRVNNSEALAALAGQEAMSEHRCSGVSGD